MIKLPTHGYDFPEATIAIITGWGKLDVSLTLIKLVQVLRLSQ